MSIAEAISGGLATPLVAGPGVVGGAIVKAITNLTDTLTAEAVRVAAHGRDEVPHSRHEVSRGRHEPAPHHHPVVISPPGVAQNEVDHKGMRVRSQRASLLAAMQNGRTAARNSSCVL